MGSLARQKAKTSTGPLLTRRTPVQNRLPCTVLLFTVLPFTILPCTVLPFTVMPLTVLPLTVLPFNLTLKQT